MNGDSTHGKTTSASGPFNESEPDQLLLKFGRYEQLEFLGQGGMARVYKAFDPTLGRTVALKFIRGDEPQLAERLMVEARAQARLEHEHLCRIYEVGEIEKKPYIAMQYIKGRTLREIMSELSLPQKVKIMIDVSLAVHAAHRAGLIHRDLKPSNIMVEQTEDKQAVPYVMDFGLAREMQAPGMTSTGVIVGSPAYMSPEQARGEVHKLDRRSDVFSLGVTLYELLCGELPFEGNSSLEILIKVEREEAIPLRKRNSTIPLDLETIVMKCLEKNPSHRYDSAKALAEDLKNYHEGESIQARPDSTLQRLVKRTRRNKTATVIGLVGAIAVLILSAMALHTRWQAKEAAEFSRQFGEEVEHLEATMRQAYLLPLHDTTAERKTVLARMAWIEKQMTESDAAYGAGEYALGRGWMVLRDYSKARKHLDQAWNTYHLQTPKVAQALGMTMAMLFKKALHSANGITDKPLKEKKLQEIDRDFKRPALDYLSKGRGMEGSRYGEALIALLEKDYDLAQKKAEQAFQQSPSLYEAKLLKGDILMAQANSKRNEGDNQRAQELYTGAEAAYREAMKAGESDPATYESLCSLKVDLIQMQLYQTGSSPSESYQAALEACDQALKANPESVVALSRKATAAGRQGEYEYNHGGNPSSLIQRAIDDARRALTIDPDSAEALYALCRPYWLKGNYERNTGVDPRNSFMQVIEFSRRAVKVDASDAGAYNIMGLAYGNIGGYEKNTGLDPRPTLDHSIEFLQRSAQINPASPLPWSNLSIPYLFRYEYEVNHGLDPTESVQKTLEYTRKALSVNPKYLNAYNQLGLAWLLSVDYKTQTGGNPESDFEEARQAFEKALEINPTFLQVNGNLGYGYSLLARYQLDHGQDAAALSINRAIENLQISVKGGFAGNLSLNFLGIAYLEKAEYEELHKRDPRKSWESAAQTFEKSCAISVNHADEFGGICSAYLAETYLRLCAFLISRQELPREGLRKVEDFLSQAHKVNPAFHYTRRLRGETNLLRGHWEMKNERSPEAWFGKASELLQQAAGINSRDAETWNDLAQLYAWLAEWRSAHSLPAQEAIDRGLSFVDKALGVNPQSARALLLRGSLLRTQVALTPEPARRKEWERQSVESIRQASAINPLKRL